AGEIQDVEFQAGRLRQVKNVAVIQRTVFDRVDLCLGGEGTAADAVKSLLLHILEQIGQRRGQSGRGSGQQQAVLKCPGVVAAQFVLQTRQIVRCIGESRRRH